MINSFRSTIIFNTFLLATGLTISFLAGCAVTPPDATTDTPRVIKVTRGAKVAVRLQQAQQIRQQHYLEKQQKLQTQARLKQLKQDQLQAHADKSAHSRVDTITLEPKQAPLKKTVTIKHNTLATNYTVGAGENLYSIAAKENIYHEGVLWPLIYKANRDQIKDPQQIFPGQGLTITRKHSNHEKEAARETARKSGIFIQQ